jgi:hypothetical protein
MIYLLLFSLNCERRFIITEHTENPDNQYIVGFCGTGGYRVTMDILYKQFFSIYGYDDSQISVILDTLGLTEQKNLTCRKFTGQYNLKYNQNVTIYFNIDNLSGIYSDIVPDSIRIRNHYEYEFLHTDKPLTFEWNPVQNADYYLVKVYLENINIKVDTTFTTYDTLFTMPEEFIKDMRRYTFLIYAISGPPPKVTDQSNIQGSLKGRIYVFSYICIEIIDNFIINIDT